jgi:hypothetical protein
MGRRFHSKNEFCHPAPELSTLIKSNSRSQKKKSWHMPANSGLQKFLAPAREKRAGTGANSRLRKIFGARYFQYRRSRPFVSSPSSVTDPSPSPSPSPSRISVPDPSPSTSNAAARRLSSAPPRNPESFRPRIPLSQLPCTQL